MGGKCRKEKAVEEVELMGGVVHTFLVNELSRAHLVDCKQKNQHNIILPGCVVVLQIIIWDWTLTVECRSNPIVRVALNIDGETINEDDDDSGESNFEDICMKKVKMNEMEIIAMKK
ncbi:hypothetical protein DEO72_LG9g892 [Vigna unguiculata]|uniref:Uncharacterized protein n=1 Tax=Vigna unguiculata TaxID=3917 RepID=A0A4D6MYW8_VIGUN|nr:hypothetical protein DEO72_LG9g892 [Vigna unguiculata]